MTVTIRAATLEDAPGIARVQAESWCTTYTGLIPDEVIAQYGGYDRRVTQWTRTFTNPDHTQAIFVADHQRQIVGFASGGPQRDPDLPFASELYAIYVLEAYQRQGLGARLTAAVVDHLIAAGYPSMLVWVLADNPARRFYQRIGGTFVREQPFDLGGSQQIEAGYGWNDMNALRKRLLP
jgi:ribosomal protein S18 acetylase RimI-like enzyme